MKTGKTLGPGPAEYDPYCSRYNESPSHSIRPRWREQAVDQVPAPNKYKPNEAVVRRSAPYYSIKEKAESCLVAQKELVSNPAPGEYLISYKSVNNATPRFALRSRVYGYETDVTPAPNYYDTARAHDFVSVRNASPAFTLRTRTAQPKTDTNTPGPAAYTFSRPFSAGSPAFSFKSKHELYKYETLLIGPGSYDVSRKDYGRAALFAGRTYIKQRDQYPGPSTYNPQKPPRHSPYFSLAGRNVPYIRSESPGPIYNVQTKFFSGPGITIKNRNYIDYDNGVPGVGYYSACAQVSRPASALSMHGHYRRFSDVGTDVPAPTAYNLACQNVDRRGVRSPVHCYIGQKTEIPRNQNCTPGPGAYEVQGTFIYKRGSRQIKFTKEELDAIMKGTKYAHKQPPSGDY